jgi:hypothetical protein
MPLNRLGAGGLGGRCAVCVRQFYPKPAAGAFPGFDARAATHAVKRSIDDGQTDTGAGYSPALCRRLAREPSWSVAAYPIADWGM